MANENSDVKLLDHQVKVEAWDFCLESNDRRKKEDKNPQRRALVHDYEDGLTVNWGDDYPGGVTVNGVTKINGRKGKGTTGTLAQLQLMTIESAFLNIHSTGLNFIGNNFNFKSEPENPAGVKISGNVNFSDKVVFTGSAKVSRTLTTPVRQPNGAVANVPVLMELDLFDEIMQLRKKIAELEKKFSVV